MEPVRETLGWGQVNLFLVALVLADVVALRPRLAVGRRRHRAGDGDQADAGPVRRLPGAQRPAAGPRRVAVGTFLAARRCSPPRSIRRRLAAVLDRHAVGDRPRVGPGGPDRQPVAARRTGPARRGRAARPPGASGSLLVARSSSRIGPARGPCGAAPARRRLVGVTLTGPAQRAWSARSPGPTTCTGWSPRCSCCVDVAGRDAAATAGSPAWLRDRPRAPCGAGRGASPRSPSVGRRRSLGSLVLVLRAVIAGSIATPASAWRCCGRNAYLLDRWSRCLAARRLRRSRDVRAAARRTARPRPAGSSPR